MKAKVKFKVDHYTYKKDDTELLADATARTLVESGIATLVVSKKK